MLACKGCRLSDWGGRSLSLLASSQLIINPDIQEAHLLKGWYEHEGHQKDFTGFRSEGGSGAGGGRCLKQSVIHIRTVKQMRVFGDNLSLVTRKPVFRVSNQVIL